MSRQRDRREAKAFSYLTRNGCASALEIGDAAVRGEVRARRIPWRGKEAIGMSIAIALTRRGILRPTRGNRFRLI